MARKIKRSAWIVLFNSAVGSAKRLIKHPDELRQLIEEAMLKVRKHSSVLREIAVDFQVILRLVKAWLARDYKDISIKSVVLFIGAILYLLNPFDAIPDVIPVVGYVDDVSVVAWVLKILKDEIEKFRVWESGRAH